MVKKAQEKGAKFNIYMIAQKGRIGYEAALALASLRRFSPNFQGEVFVIEPQPGPLWENDPRVPFGRSKELLITLSDHYVPLHSKHFGATYPQGNKIEALALLPPKQPFLFLDSDTLVLNDLQNFQPDFSKPSASNLCTNTWPKVTAQTPQLDHIWGSLYAKFALNFEAAQNTNYPPHDWRRYPYYNAGWFYGDCPKSFGKVYLDYAKAIQTTPPREIQGQNLNPWLDQVALPLVIHALGGGRVTHAPLDTDLSLHYRFLARAFARGSVSAVEKLMQLAQQPHLARVLSEYPPFYDFFYTSFGATARSFALKHQNLSEESLRAALIAAKLWYR